MSECGCGCDLGWEDYRAAFNRSDNRIKKEADAIALELSGIDKEGVIQGLYSIMCGYKERLVGAGILERAPDAKQQMKDVAEQANTLLDSMRKLGQGSMQCMYRECEHSGQWANAEPWEIPATGGGYGKPHGAWAVRLTELAELASLAAERLEKEISKGGRIPFTKRLVGITPEEGLAEDCMAFAGKHGCNSKAVVVRMVQAIMETEHGKEAMKKMDGKPSKDKGRKAVRKLARTKPKIGTV